MKESAKYPKIVEWSEEDRCYIGNCPGFLFGGCCHGNDENKVFAELCAIVEEWIQIAKDNGEHLPPPPSSVPLPAYIPLTRPGQADHDRPPVAPEPQRTTL